MADQRYRITVAGMGYVGLSMAVLLAQHHRVTAVDILQSKVSMVNNRISPIKDEYISQYLKEKPLDLTATTDDSAAYKEADFVIIATPTDYDSEKNTFDTRAVESVLEQVYTYNPQATVVIKSTVPVGYTANLRNKYPEANILFSPEFLREGMALYDNLYPSRIIVGTDTEDEELTKKARTFADILKQGAEKQDIPTIIMGYSEAEAVKLFAITYLALRVSYFKNWILMQKVRAWTAVKSLKGSAWIHVSVTITTIPASATAATVCQRIPNSCWQTTGMCRRI